MNQFLLRSDAECLMRCPQKIVQHFSWNWEVPIQKWRGVIIDENQRIVELHLDGTVYDDTGNRKLGETLTTKNMVFPPKLRFMRIERFDIQIGTLILPDTIEELHVDTWPVFKNDQFPLGLTTISLEECDLNHGVYRFPHWLMHLNLEQCSCENIHNCILLPPTLQSLSISHTSVTEQTYASISFPCTLKILDLTGSEIGESM